jgi:Putative  PD-(D/E)XK family member, (DUF4420)
MVMSRATDLQETWGSIASPPRGSLAGRRIPDLRPNLRVWAAIDSARTPHLLVQVPSGVGPLALERTRGLEVTVDEMRIGSDPTATYLALACLDANLTETFSALCGEVADALNRDGDDPIAAARTVIRRWRRFWQISGGGLSREECLGLFGELWFLEGWVGLRRGVAVWTGSSGSRHDFQTEDWSVEVKASSRRNDGLVHHHINGIDQLAEPESGKLYLFSLQVVDDQLSANTLPGLVDRIRSALETEPDVLDTFLDGLERRGYSPGDAHRYEFRWRILAEELYRVGHGFPRIVRNSFDSGLPNGVGEVSYYLNIAACEQWRIARAPDEVGAGFLRVS